MDDWAKIRQLFSTGQHSKREISRLVGVPRGTVDRPLETDRVLLAVTPTMPASVLAERVGWSGSASVFRDKVAATLMFGFWVKTLGRGTFYQVEDGPRQRRTYDTLLWKSALRKVFPNVGEVDRARVEAAARNVQALRNRIAHHEHIVWGIPPGSSLKCNGWVWSAGSIVR